MPATSERALEPVAGTISGTAELANVSRANRCSSVIRRAGRSGRGEDPAEAAPNRRQRSRKQCWTRSCPHHKELVPTKKRKSVPACRGARGPDLVAGTFLSRRGQSVTHTDALQRGGARAPRAGLAGQRSPEGESASGVERAEGRDARSERPATGHGRPRSHAWRIERSLAPEIGEEITNLVAREGVEEPFGHERGLRRRR